MIKNYANGKAYVGQTIQKLSRRMSEHLSMKKNSKKNIKLYNALRKHGRNSFYFGVICDANDQKSLNEFESHYIVKHNTIENGYNLREGGSNGGRLSIETKQKIGNANRGKKRSEETKLQMSESHLGKKGPAMPPHVREAILKSRLGKTHSAETKQKISLSMKTHIQNKKGEI